MHFNLQGSGHPSLITGFEQTITQFGINITCSVFHILVILNNTFHFNQQITACDGVYLMPFVVQEYMNFELKIAMLVLISSSTSAISGFYIFIATCVDLLFQISATTTKYLLTVKFVVCCIYV